MAVRTIYKQLCRARAEIVRQEVEGQGTGEIGSLCRGSRRVEMVVTCLHLSSCFKGDGLKLWF